MAVTVGVAALACAQVFGKVCAMGRELPADTPAAGYLAAGARLVDEAAGMLHRSGEAVPTLQVAARRLAAAEALLQDVAIMHSHAGAAGLHRLTMVVQGLSVSLDPQAAATGRPAQSAPDAPGETGAQER